MANLNADRFLELVCKSKLVEEDKLDLLVEEARKAHDGELPSADELADRLCEAGLITEWHREKLLEKKYKGFFLGKYKLLGHLGTGGMSSVYLAENTLLHCLRAIKVLPKKRVNDSSYLERFRLEAKATAALDHPNIVRAYDRDQEGDTYYWVMEYVAGKDLQTLVKDDGPTEFETAANYISQAARGLQHAHDKGLVHRDVKPANLLVDEKGAVKILDLGLVLSADEDASLTMAHNENVLGTADYLAPEQALNSHQVDSRADVYSLGCTLYFLLTGHAPFPDGTLAQRIAKHQTQMPADIREVRPDCPGELVGICVKMLQKEPTYRYHRIADVADKLEAWLAHRGYTISRGEDSVVRLVATSAAAAGKASSRLPTATALAPTKTTPGRKKPSSNDDTASDQAEATIKGMPRTRRPGSGSGPRPGSKSGSKSGSRSGSKSGSKSGSRSGSRSGSKTGSSKNLPVAKLLGQPKGGSNPLPKENKPSQPATPGQVQIDTGTRDPEHVDVDIELFPVKQPIEGEHTNVLGERKQRRRPAPSSKLGLLITGGVAAALLGGVLIWWLLSMLMSGPAERDTSHLPPRLDRPAITSDVTLDAPRLTRSA